MVPDRGVVVIGPAGPGEALFCEVRGAVTLVDVLRNSADERVEMQNGCCS
jgi:hypothetical protein